MFRISKSRASGLWWPAYHWTESKLLVHALYCFWLCCCFGSSCFDSKSDTWLSASTSCWSASGAYRKP